MVGKGWSLARYKLYQRSRGAITWAEGRRRPLHKENQVLPGRQIVSAVATYVREPQGRLGSFSSVSYSTGMAWLVLAGLTEKLERGAAVGSSKGEQASSGPVQPLTLE